MKVKVKIELKLQDAWIGVFWRWGSAADSYRSQFPVLDGVKTVLDVWVCLVPCIPIHVTVDRTRPRVENYLERALGLDGKRTHWSMPARHSHSS